MGSNGDAESYGTGRNCLNAALNLHGSCKGLDLYLVTIKSASQSYLVFLYVLYKTRYILVSLLGDSRMKNV